MKLEFVHASRDHGWYYKDVSAHTQRVIFAQGQPVPLAVAQEIASELNEPRWLPWDNDFCPTRDDLRIDVMLRDGTFWYHQRAGDCDWSRHNGVDGMQDIVIFRRNSASDIELVDGHDIEAFQMANQHLVRHADAIGPLDYYEYMFGKRQEVEWPDESRADRDPTAIMGGVVAHDAGGCAPPVLTEKVRDWEPLLSAAYLALQLTTVAVGFITVLLAIGQGDVTGAAVMTALSVMWMSCAADTHAARLEMVNG